MVAVVGEALIDLVQQPADPGAPSRFIAYPGGSPFNVAIGLARLGQPVQFFARSSADNFGRQLRAYAASNSLSTRDLVAATEPSTLAVVGLDDRGIASYDFYVAGTADWQWTDQELMAVSAAQSWVHTGSLASWLNPGASAITRRLRALADSATIISFDPNVRPALMPEHAEAVGQIEQLIALSQVVKASADDVEWLYPESSMTSVLSRWSGLGPALVVVTDGADGASAAQADGHMFEVPGRPVTVADTVGAGDSFMAGLINAIIGSGVAPAQLTGEQAQAAVQESVLVASLTCQRAGANPPTAAELAAARSR